MPVLPQGDASLPPSAVPSRWGPLKLGVSFIQRRAGISCPELHLPAPPITWQVNDVPFQNLTREEAVQVLLGLPLGEEVELVTQRKQDSEWGGEATPWGRGRPRRQPPPVLPPSPAQSPSLPTVFRKMVQSRVGDSFYVRTHFELEPSPPYGLGFTRGDVFHVLDTLYSGPGQSHTRGGQWLAVRMGRDLREQERGIIPNQKRWGPLSPSVRLPPSLHLPTLSLLCSVGGFNWGDVPVARGVQSYLCRFPRAAVKTVQMQWLQSTQILEVSNVK